MRDARHLIVPILSYFLLYIILEYLTMAIHDETFHATSKSDNFRSWRSVHLGRENKNKLAFRPNLLRLFATVFKTAPIC